MLISTFQKHIFVISNCCHKFLYFFCNSKQKSRIFYQHLSVCNVQNKILSFSHDLNDFFKTKQTQLSQISNFLSKQHIQMDPFHFLFFQNELPLIFKNIMNFAMLRSQVLLTFDLDLPNFAFRQLLDTK